MESISPHFAPKVNNPVRTVAALDSLDASQQIEHLELRSEMKCF
jgi:hypothetical protein